MLTITEALAEVKTIGKRIASKQGFITMHVIRNEQLKDPLSKDGGQPAVIERELQAIRDLGLRIVAIRSAIAKANAETTITIGGQTRSIADWLTWRREVAPVIEGVYRAVAEQVRGGRAEATKRGWSVVGAAVAVSGEVGQPPQVLVNVDEGALAATLEEMQTTLGALDGQLSLKNATVTLNL